MSSRSVDSRPPEAAWSEVERELLGAAREERMPAELEARLRDALGFAPGSAETPSRASAEAAPRTSFNDSARARQLFASKLPLWGMLGIVAMGAVGYYALSRGASQPTAAATRPQVTAPAPHEAAPLAASASAPGATAHSSASAQHDTTTQDGTSSAPARARHNTGTTQRDGVGLASASAQAGSRREAASARRDGVASARRDGVASAGGDVTRAPESAWPDGVGSASASAQASARRDATSAQRERAGGELAHAREGRRAEASSVRPRAAMSTEMQAAPPPMAAESGTPQATRSDASRARAAHPDQLRLEAQLLESARSALGHGALPEARLWLARYQTQFARGALQPESQVLGIELAVRTGARATAKAQAEHFLAQHPHHPLRDRVQLLAGDVR